MFPQYLLDGPQRNSKFGEKVSHARIRVRDLILRGSWHPTQMISSTSVIDGASTIRGWRRQAAPRFLRTFSKTKQMQLKIPHGAGTGGQDAARLMATNLRFRECMLCSLTIRFMYLTPARSAKCALTVFDRAFIHSFIGDRASSLLLSQFFIISGPNYDGRVWSCI